MAVAEKTRCEQHPGMCCKDPNCRDRHCPGRAEAIEILLQLQREIADETCRVDVECDAREVRCDWPMPVYDVSDQASAHMPDDDIRASTRATIARAICYLDLRGLITRPFPGKPHLVCFVERS